MAALLSDGDPLQLLQPVLGEALRVVAFLDLLGYVPTDPKVAGDIADDETTRKYQSLSLEGTGLGAQGIGEADFDFEDHATAQAFVVGDGSGHDDGLAADGFCPEEVSDVAARLDLRRISSRAAAGLEVLIDDEDDLTTLRLGAGILVAANADVTQKFLRI